MNKKDANTGIFILRNSEGVALLNITIKRRIWSICDQYKPRSYVDARVANEITIVWGSLNEKALDYITLTEIEDSPKYGMKRSPITSKGYK